MFATVAVLPPASLPELTRTSPSAATTTTSKTRQTQSSSQTLGVRRDVVGSVFARTLANRQKTVELESAHLSKLAFQIFDFVTQTCSVFEPKVNCRIMHFCL